MSKSKISKGLIKVGFRPEELKDLVRICRATVECAKGLGLGDLEDKAELWEKNFKVILKTNKEAK